MVPTLPLGLILSFALVAPPPSGDIPGAARAFGKGQAALGNRDYRDAAEQFELANLLAPSAAALRSAARSRLLAEQPALAASHAAMLAKLYPEDEASTNLVKKIFEETEHETSRYIVKCTPACTLTSDNKALAMEATEEHDIFLNPGPHELIAGFEDNRNAKQQVDGQPGEQTALEMTDPGPTVEDEPTKPTTDPPAAPEPPPTQEAIPQGRRRVHPAVAATGIVLTVGLGATTTWSGIATFQARDDFNRNPTQNNFDRGETQQLTTNILIGATAAVGVATVVIAIVTDWRRPRRKNKETRVALAPLAILGRF